MTGISPRVALVTGANRGIGLEIARQLAEAGVSVLIGARAAARGEAAAYALARDGLAASFLPLDLGDGDSLRAAAARIEAEHGRLDILVNNAGIADPEDGPPEAASLAAVRRVFETNFMGTLVVTQAMLPLLRKSPAGRIVNLSSGLGSLEMNGDPASAYYGVRPLGYNASKAALNMLTVLLAEELRDTAIQVNSVCPGYVKTELNGNRGVLSPAEAAEAPVRLALMPESGHSGRFVNATGELPW